MEVWKPIKGYENHYEISDLGRIRSIDRFVPFYGSQKFCKGKIKKLTPHYKNKYLSVMLKVEQNEKRFSVHRLVAQHFIENPENKPEVNHLFGDKNDNRAIALEWSTEKENTNHAINTGLTRHRMAVVATQQQSIIEFKSKTDCALYFRTTNTQLNIVVNRNKEFKGHRFYFI